MSAYPLRMNPHPKVTGFFDEATNRIGDTIRAPARAACTIVDSVMDIIYAAGRATTSADHLSAAPYLQERPNDKSRADFIAKRQVRDATRAMPRLILPSLQVKIQAGESPRDEGDKPMLKAPTNRLYI